MTPPPRLRVLAGVGAAFGLGCRRLRSRPIVFLLLALALSASAALIGWSSVIVARAQERSVQLRLGARQPSQRAIAFRYFTAAGQPDFREPTSTAALRSFALNALSRAVTGGLSLGT